MKIVKSCNEAEAKSKVNLTIEQIPVGTIFRYGDHTAGPYLRTSTGMLGLSSHFHQTHTYGTVISNYKPLDKAVLVLNED